MKNFLSRARAAAASLWAREPVLVATAGPVLVSIGVISQAQLSTATTVASAVGVVAAQIVAALGIRSKVSSPAATAQLQTSLSRARVSVALARVQRAGEGAAQAIETLRAAAVSQPPPAATPTAPVTSTPPSPPA